MAVQPAAVDGARVDALANWLMDRALGACDPAELLTGCCDRLVAARIPLARAHLGYRTLHPLFRAVTLTWQAGRGLARREHRDGDLREALEAVPAGAAAGSGIGRTRHRLEDSAPAPRVPPLDHLRAQGLSDYSAWGVNFGACEGHEPAGSDCLVGSWATGRPGGFRDEELAVLKRIERRLAVACKVSIKEQAARNILRAYLGPDAGERVYAGSIARGSGEVIHAVIWFADLRDSTRLSGEMPLGDFLALLNDFFECIAGAVLDHGGEVLRFIGDAVLAVFPMVGHHAKDVRMCPVHRAACATALVAARDAVARVSALNVRRVRGGLPPIGYGIGLHVGDVMYGNIGVPSRVEFSVVGATANHAAKMESLCKVLGVPVVVSSDFAEILPGQWVSLGRHVLPGVAREQEVHTLAELAPSPAA